MKKARLFKLLSILLIFSFIFFIPQIISKTVKIKKIECLSQFGNCPNELKGYFDKNIGRSYWDIKKEISKALKENALVSDFLIQFKLPNSIKIELVLKEPWASVFLNNVYYFVTEDGVIIHADTKSNLVNLNLSENGEFKFGQEIKSSYLNALKLLKKLEFTKSVKTCNIKTDELICNIDGIAVRFPVEGDIDYLTGAVRLIFSRLNEGKEGFRMEDVAEIDLRFKDPILRLLK